MWAAPGPSSDVRSVYPDCVADISDPLERALFDAREQDVYGKSDAFTAALTAGASHALDPSQFETSPLTAASMAKFYRLHLVGARSPQARSHYDRIRSASQFCYACGHEIAEEVDHYLPKHRFPALVVTPENLTPICIRCNRAKGVTYGKTPSEAFIHPYVDDFESVVWLHATLQITPEPHLTFSASHSNWDVVTTDRAKNHMRRFNLSHFYGIQANRAARQARGSLDRHFSAGRDRAVRAEAVLRASSSRDDRLNSWEAAAWTAFAESDWFCEGGFREFGRVP